MIPRPLRYAALTCGLLSSAIASPGLAQVAAAPPASAAVATTTASPNATSTTTTAAPPSAVDLAQQAADPTSPLMTFNAKYSVTPSYYGLEDTGHAGQFQPVIPFRAWGIDNILRPTLSFADSGPGAGGLTDVTVFNLFVFNKSWGRWGFGPVMQLLPGRGDGRDRFAIGPALGFVRSRGKWTYGLFNQNLFGSDTAISSLQPVIAYQLGNGWALSSGEMQLTMDWKRGGLVNVPFGVQLSKVTTLAGQPVKYALNPEYNARSIDGAPRWQVRFTFTVLAPAK